MKRYHYRRRPIYRTWITARKIDRVLYDLWRFWPLTLACGVCMFFALPALTSNEVQQSPTAVRELLKVEPTETNTQVPIESPSVTTTARIATPSVKAEVERVKLLLSNYRGIDGLVYFGSVR